MKNLNATDLAGVKNKEFILLLIEEDSNNLVITGCDHFSDDALNHLSKQLEKCDNDLKKKLIK